MDEEDEEELEGEEVKCLNSNVVIKSALVMSL